MATVTRIFWDTMLFIYLLEDHPEHGVRIAAMAHKMAARGDVLCTSALAVAEVLAGVEKAGDAVLKDRCLAFFQTPALVILPFDMRAVPTFASLRGKHKIAAPDAIHLACAATYGVDLFLTQDKRLAGKHVPGVRFLADLTQDIL